RIPVFLSTVYSCGIACSSSRSAGIFTARATSFARSTSDLSISSPLTATIPLLTIAWTCSPAIPAYTSLTWAPAMRSASWMALRIERVVSSISATTPRRMPVVRACPTPSTLSPGCLGSSPTTSPMMAVVLAEPMSRPATMRSGFMASEEPSSKACDHLISITQVQLDGAKSAAGEVMLHQLQIRESLQRNIGEGPHGKRVQDDQELRAVPLAPDFAHPTIQPRRPCARVAEQAQDG